MRKTRKALCPITLLLAVFLATGCSSPAPQPPTPQRPAPQGNWGEGVHLTADRTADCDADDLVAGDNNCTDAHYVEAFGYAGVTSKADYGNKYGFYQAEKYKEEKKKKSTPKPKTTSLSPRK